MPGIEFETYCFKKIDPGLAGNALDPFKIIAAIKNLVDRIQEIIFILERWQELMLDPV